MDIGSSKTPYLAIAILVTIPTFTILGFAGLRPQSSTVKTAITVGSAAPYMFVVDYGNNRVLGFTAPLTNGMNASVVIGQPDFISNRPLSQGPNSLNAPTTAVFDAKGNLWVADSNGGGQAGGSRILQFKPPFMNGMNASLVIGHGNFTNTSPPSGSCGDFACPTGQESVPTQNTVSRPMGLAFDNSGDLFVVDLGNARVLEFKPPFTMSQNGSMGQNASVVFEASDFNSIGAAGGIYGIAADAGGDLWFGMQGPAQEAQSPFLSPPLFNIAEFQPPFSNNMNASLVLGGSGCPLVPPNQAPTPNCLSIVSRGLAFDHTDNLWVADTGNERVLEFSPPFSAGMNAALALGQPDLTTFSPVFSPAAKVLQSPDSLAFDLNGNLWVSDPGFARVVEFEPPFSNDMNAATVVGEPDFATNLNNSQINCTSPTAAPICVPAGIAFNPLVLTATPTPPTHDQQYHPPESEDSVTARERVGTDGYEHQQGTQRAEA